MAKGNVTVSKICQGQTIYLVNAIGCESSLQAVMIKSKPIPIILSDGVIMDVPIQGYYDDILKTKVYSFMACDYNVHPEKNVVGAEHRAFFSKKKAKRWLKRVRRLSWKHYVGTDELTDKKTKINHKPALMLL